MLCLKECVINVQKGHRKATSLVHTAMSAKLYIHIISVDITLLTLVVILFEVNVV